MALATTIPNSSNSGFTLFIIQNEWSITVYVRSVYKRLSNFQTQHVTTWQHSTAVREMAETSPPPWPEVWIALRIAVAHRSKTVFVIKLIIYK